MKSDERIDKDYKQSFNLGYELAKELSLKSPMFKNQNSGKIPTNAIQAGMLQYIEEAKLLKNKNISQSKKIQRSRDKSKNAGKGLSP